MAALLAILSALVYGGGDFCGGLAARRSPALLVAIGAEVVGAAGLAALVVLVPPDAVGAGDLAWGGAAGLSGSIGLALLYGALAAGTMSVVAPLAAVWSAVVPVVVGLASGERPSLVALVGVVLALPAIALVAGDSDASAAGPGRQMDRATLVRALGAGTAFGVYFVLLAQCDEAAGLAPLVPGRLAGAVLLIALALVSGRLAPLARAAWPLTALCGVLDASANAFYLLAAQRGLLSLVAVLGALYPASTLVLARVVLGERLGRRQLAGLTVAAVAVGLVAGGG